jgi:hypothetical protein
MPKNQVVLPQAALDHMPETAQSHLPPALQPPVSIQWVNPSGSEALFGTAGVQDVFVIDLAITSPHLIWDLAPTQIDGFTLGEDTIAFINVPSSTNVSEHTFAEQVFGATSGGNLSATAWLNSNYHTLANSFGVSDDPSVTDIFFGVQGNYEGIYALVWDLPSTYVPSISSTNIVTLADETLLTLPPDPYMWG